MTDFTFLPHHRQNETHEPFAHIKHSKKPSKHKQQNETKTARRKNHGTQPIAEANQILQQNFDVWIYGSASKLCNDASHCSSNIALDIKKNHYDNVNSSTHYNQIKNTHEKKNQKRVEKMWHLNVTLNLPIFIFF